MTTVAFSRLSDPFVRPLYVTKNEQQDSIEQRIVREDLERSRAFLRDFLTRHRTAVRPDEVEILEKSQIS